MLKKYLQGCRRVAQSVQHLRGSRGEGGGGGVQKHMVRHMGDAAICLLLLLIDNQPESGLRLHSFCHVQDVHCRPSTTRRP
jgi:hypothetical protein